jgi:hypothetical protein
VSFVVVVVVVVVVGVYSQPDPYEAITLAQTLFLATALARDRLTEPTPTSQIQTPQDSG